jgi:hypothetical protein
MVRPVSTDRDIIERVLTSQPPANSVLARR